jgi:hypothetical protein
MVATVATSTTRKILNERIERYDRQLAKRKTTLMKWAARQAQKSLEKQGSVRIEAYTPHLTAPNSWLPIVEERIRASVLPEEFEREPSSEWLTQDAAFAAIAFFHTGADLLPTEPYIYATSLGDLVAEFETKNGSMTSVISDNETILFAVLASDPHEPIQKVIRRGSNQFKEELRSITTKLSSGRHGKMEPAR